MTRKGEKDTVLYKKYELVRFRIDRSQIRIQIETSSYLPLWPPQTRSKSVLILFSHLRPCPSRPTLFPFLSSSFTVWLLPVFQSLTQCLKRPQIHLRLTYHPCRFRITVSIGSTTAISMPMQHTWGCVSFNGSTLNA